VPNYAALGRALGVSRDQVSKWRNRQSRPYAECMRVAKEQGVSLDWLLMGVGDMRSGARPEPPPPAAEIEDDEAAGSSLHYRIAALTGLLGQLEPGDSDAILTAALSRATEAQRLAALERAVQKFSEKRPRKRAGKPSDSAG